MAKASLMDRMKKNRLKGLETSILSESKTFSDKFRVSTSVYALNIALSGSLFGGIGPGILQVAGPSRHFKTLYSLLMMRAYLEADPDAIALFYDTEHGTTPDYVSNFGIDPSRIVHIPVLNVEHLVFDLMNRLDSGKDDSIQRGDKVFIMVDSIGNLASKKEMEDAHEGKSKTDMSRAKSLKAFYRMVTPYLNMYDIPMVCINHTYEEIGPMYAKTIMSGGTGGYYSANAIWMIGKSQEKKGTELVGYNFKIKIEKSRDVREKAVIPVIVNFEGGISPYAGLFDIAQALGSIKSPSMGWYVRDGMHDKDGVVIEDPKKWRKDDTDCPEFWEPLIKQSDFEERVQSFYRLGANSLTAKWDRETAIAALEAPEAREDA